MIVNGIDNPRIECPFGTAGVDRPEELHVNGDTVTCAPLGCIVQFDWTPYEGTPDGATFGSMWCSNQAGDSPTVPLYAPEPPGGLMLLAVGLLLGVVLYLRRK